MGYSPKGRASLCLETIVHSFLHPQLVQQQLFSSASGSIPANGAVISR